MGLGIIGQINSNEINCQLFQTIYTYYKFFENRNQKNIQFQFYIQNWPFLFNKNGQLQENTYQNIEPLIPTDSLQTIPEINNSVEVCTKELEEELNYWTEELDQNLEQETQNYLEIENNFNNFINSVSDQQLENQIYRTIQFTGLIFPCQFQINLQEFQHRLPEQNKIQLVRRIISWQQNLYNNNYDQIQNSLNSRRETMHILQNRIQIQNMDQIFENFQNQNINNNIFNERDNDQFSIFETFTEMDLQNNQHIEIENQLPQQLQLEQNIQPSTISQFQKIQNIVNSALKNRKQTLKHLGNIDRQLIQQFFLKFFYVDDDFGSNNTYINEFLISIGTKGNFSNQITQDIIKVLQMTTQNQRQENVDQEPLIISKNGVIRDLEQTKNFVQLKALKLFIQLQLTSTSNISDENAQELIELLYKLKGKSLQNLLQFLGNQEDKYNFQLAPNQVLNLYKFLLSQQDMKNSTNCMNLISRLEHNITHFMAANKIKINKISEYYNNQFLNQLQVEQAFKQLNELEKIFQMIQIIFRKDENNHYQCQEFLNSEEVQRLFNVLESLISQIQNLNDSRLLPLLKAFLICYQTKSQFNTQNLQFLKISSMEISTEILIDFENLFKRLCLNGKDYINHIVKQQINIMNNECKMMKVRRNRLTENNQLFEKDFLEGILNVHPQAINFQNKKNYFYSKLEINRLSQQQLQRYPIKVSKSQIFEDSYNEITKISSLDIFRFKRFFILYDGEIGQDGGGMTTDWIGKLSKSILDQQYQLFIPNSDNTCYLINTESTDPDHLRKFKFVGMFMAIAIICKVNIKGYFPNSYFKHIVGQKLSRSDIQQHDEGIYNSLNTIYNQKIDSSWNLYWLYNIKRNGVFIDEELKPGGSDIEVTEEDKKDFVRKYCYQIMAKNIENQIKAIQEGFYSIIPKNDIKIFDSIQLEQLLCGEQYIDVEDLISNLIYQGCNAQNQVIKWLQNTLRNFNQDMLVKFLKLATSRTNLPIGGFSNKECRITIVLLNNLQNDIDSRYPEGHTCARSIGLPPYSNEQTLQQKLEEALISQGDRFDLI
ncbi:unnamed protein product [Paramecium sonneborni]|uniref:HECT domain-containing protein n=1 Tax=Paramecium sonneborni TaxID=65129 RepID=A0A8S1KU92_9CILI|nr:unnamed protein product [Paramecium sonneborni]